MSDRRKFLARDDDDGVSTHEPAPGAAEAALLAAYDRSLPAVYGYLLTRCGDTPVAEDLTAETFLAAVAAVRGPTPPDVTVRWLIGVARHKLADHWRGEGRERNRLAAVVQQPGHPATQVDDDPWDAELDRLAASQTMHQIAPQHRLVLTLHYVDDLPVSEVADLIGRSVHATEGLLVRARQSFRRHYARDMSEEGGDR